VTREDPTDTSKENVMKTLEIDQDEVLQHMQNFNTEDSERASDAGESRQRIGTFLEKTGINNKAFATCRAVLRMKKDDKRQDWLRSMRALMPLMEQEIAKDGTKDAFDVPAAAKDLAADGFPDPDFEDDLAAQADDEAEADQATGDEAGDEPGAEPRPDDADFAAAQIAASTMVKQFKPRAKAAAAQ
jgi:hypothetical protein